MTNDFGLYELETRPWISPLDHANDEVDYSGEKGTSLAFQNAREHVAMTEYNPLRTYINRCGTPLILALKEKGKWVEPLKAKGKWVKLYH